MCFAYRLVNLISMSKQPPQGIDPTELMAFLACYEDYPASGLALSRAASEQDRSDLLIHFLEHIPGEIDSEQAVVKYAVDEAGLDIPIETDEPEEEVMELDLQTVKESGGDNG
jgi:nucleotide-binding universal stress UspA family protein